MASRVAWFTITLSQAADEQVVVYYQTVAGTATAGTDFTTTSGKVTFAAGDTTKYVSVPIRDADTEGDEVTFSLELTSVLSDDTVAELDSDAESGTCTIPAYSSGDDDDDGSGDDDDSDTTYVDRFTTMYGLIKDTDNGYLGPTSGDYAYQVPYHAVEKMIVEAPDWGHESVSETASFLVGLEAWNYVLNDTYSGMTTIWDVIENVYIPSGDNAVIPDYDPDSPATYQPEEDEPDEYPTAADSSEPVGVDPIADNLNDEYSNSYAIHLMHWIIDVDGVYGYHNGDGGEVNVYINNYQRGMHESVWETVTFPCYEDFEFGMTSGPYGFLPLYNKGYELYPDDVDESNTYSEQWRYTNAPDAEIRALQWTFWADMIKGDDSNISSLVTKAKKIGDYMQYNLFDKYFRQVGNWDEAGTGYDSCLYIINWYCSWGAGIETDDNEESGSYDWSYRIGSSETHFGYQGPDVAYCLATGGAGYTPSSSGAADVWAGSVYKQLDMIRWLQTPEGPIAGGVTNSWHGRYETPDDGREDYTFNGMLYTYSPVWHDPPSNGWFGYQAWGLQRVASLMLMCYEQSTDLAQNMYYRCNVILGQFIPYFLDNSTISSSELTIPSALLWVSDSEVSGETATAANVDDVYEYLPNTSWDSDSATTAEVTAFWDSSTVPNTNLKAILNGSSLDIGTASAMSTLLLQYVEAKRQQDGAAMTDTIGTSSYTLQDAFDAAQGMLDYLWDNCRDDIGVTVNEEMTSFYRYEGTVYIPTVFSGVMPNDDTIENGATFIGIRSFMEDEDDWTTIKAAIDADENPTMQYHRTWHQCEFAIANAVMGHYFSDISGSSTDTSSS